MIKQKTMSAENTVRKVSDRDHPETLLVVPLEAGPPTTT
jgi:hypothetical protein